VTVASPGEPPREVAMVRQRYTVEQAIDARLLSAPDGERIGYIFLPSFYDERIPGQVEAALQEFGPLDGLVIDNRMNGGGSSIVVEPMLSLFASGDVGEYLSQTASRPLRITPSDVQGSQSIPLVVLIGEDTVSYGEVFAGVLQDLGRARLVGQTTAGNVETLHGYTFDDGSRLWIAEERFVPAVSLAGWEGIGVHPDVEVLAPWHAFTSENDPVVAAAIQLLTGD
jgi:C-terminal processing protease CtpA/Prc